MKINNIYIIVIGMMISFSEPLLAASDYEEFAIELLSKFENIEKSAVSGDRGTIYSKYHINSNPDLTEDNNLYEAGERFIIFLEENDRVYKELEFTDWVKATNKLFEVDDWMDTRMGWGNLVIKFAICNKVMSSVISYLDSHGTYPLDQLDSVLEILEQLRTHLPAERAMYYLAYRHYDLLEPFQASRLSYFSVDVNSVGDLPSKVRREIQNFYRKKGSDKKKIYRNEKLKLERVLEKHEVPNSQTIIDYRDLYHTPMPFMIASLSRYHNFLWDLYFEILLIKNHKGEQIYRPSVSEQEVVQLLEKEHLRGNGFWFGEHYRKYFNNQTNQDIKRRFMEVYFIRDDGVNLLRKKYKTHNELVNLKPHNQKFHRSSIPFSIHELQ